MRPGGPLRRPRPRRALTSLQELVLDLDERLEGGDALCDVWLPHEDWTRLVEEATVADALAPAPAAPPDGLRLELARALGVGVDTDWSDLVEVARGYALALEAEREASIQRLDELKPASGAGAGADDAVRAHPVDCEACEERPYVIREHGVELPGHYADREAAIADALHTRCKGGFDVCEPRIGRTWDTFRLCTVCRQVTDGHVSDACPFADLPRPAPARAEVGDAPKRRRSKKFPKGEGELEACTTCGQHAGEHAGQRCPKPQRRMKYVDEPATGEAPF